MYVYVCVCVCVLYMYIYEYTTSRTELEAALPCSTDQSRANSQRLAVVQGFLLLHLESNDVQGRNMDADSLLEQCVSMCQFLVRYGFYSQTMQALLKEAELGLVDDSLSDVAKSCLGYLKQRITALWASNLAATKSLQQWAVPLKFVVRKSKNQIQTN